MIDRCTNRISQTTGASTRSRSPTPLLIRTPCYYSACEKVVKSGVGPPGESPCRDTSPRDTSRQGPGIKDNLFEITWKYMIWIETVFDMKA